mmetsp:Transcript_13417/g.16900  ORF Transcript_13417/g.16900 Transcript_13417/m.16900 type:complete len:139 (-) Transcript_13417:143-559(-)
MRTAGMTLDEALALVKRRRPSANPLSSFLTQCREFENTCRDLGVIKEGGGVTTSRRGAGPVIRGPMVGPTTGPVQGPSRKRAIGPSRPPAVESVSAMTCPVRPPLKDEILSPSNVEASGTGSDDDSTSERKKRKKVPT